MSHPSSCDVNAISVTADTVYVHFVRFVCIFSKTHVWVLVSWYEMGGHVARLGAKGRAYMLLIGKPERNGSQGHRRRRWEDIKIYRQWGGRTWTEFILVRERTYGGLL